jgi:hypothetical protein
MMDTFSQDYARLMLTVNRHTDGFVDAYYGPPEIQTAVEAADLPPLEAVQEELETLRASIPADDPRRKAYLDAMVTAAQTALRQDDEALTYMDEVRLLFDIEPALVDDDRLLAARRSLDDALPGSGSFAERMAAYRSHYEIPADHLDRAVELALAECRRRTAELVALVPGEGFRHALVKDQHWAAYNWYQGNAQSLIEFNTDIPMEASELLDFCAHEGYPGHHTENMLREQRYLTQGHIEGAFVLLLSPGAVMAEGIATTAQEIIFPDDSHDAWYDEVLYPELGIEPHPLEMRRAINRALHELRYVAANAALRYHTGQANQAQTLDYFKTVGTLDDDRADKTLEFISHPLGRSYIFTYTAGYDLIAAAAKGGDKRSVFKHLLDKPMLPRDLAALAR